MAKSTSGGKTKATNGEPKVRRAPGRRRTEQAAAETPIAVAAETSRFDQRTALTAAGLTGSPETAGLNPEEVRRRAYEIYIGRGCNDGCDVDDWLEAERQLRNGRTH